MNFYNTYFNRRQKRIAVLIDPDKFPPKIVVQAVVAANRAGIDFFLAGGSLVSERIDETIRIIKNESDKPVIIFPGNAGQMSAEADGILFLSLISGRNPDFLIGNHVLAAPFLKKTGLEVIPTGYMLIDGKTPTSVQYMSNTMPIPRKKIDIAVATGLAGEFLGMKSIYLEAGSGAKKCVPTAIIRNVRQNISIPIIVGGGIKTTKSLENIYAAGADITVVGTSVEKSPETIFKFVELTKKLNDI